MTGLRPLRKVTAEFTAHEIDPGTFRHAEHVEVAFDLLSRHDFIDAAATYAKGIRAIAKKAGAATKFNLTITYAFMSLIAERMAQRPDDDFGRFLDRNPDILSKDVLRAWYSAERLGSKTAREVFLLPDGVSG